MKKFTYKYVRMARTDSSESYLISDSNGLVARLDIHIQKSIYGNLIIEKKLSDDAFESLIEEIDNNIISGIEPREDFIFSVFQGEEIAFYSDSKSESSYDTVRRKDFEKISKLLKKVLGRHQTARGQLNELVVCEYFKSIGYNAEKAPNALDKKKIDVIAQNSENIIFVQIKLGNIGSIEIEKVTENVLKHKIKSTKSKIVGFVANSYPNNSEILRQALEQKYKIPILFIHKYQIINTMPTYKRTIGND